MPSGSGLRIARLAAIAEDQWFERKSIRIQAKDLGRPLVALANTEGGVIVVGIAAGQVEGLRNHLGKLNELRQAPMDFTVPPVRARFDQQRCRNQDGETDSLLVIRVDPSEVVHELTNGEVYLRVGDESRRLRFAARQELQFDKGQSQYDGQPAPGVGVEILDDGLIKNYRTRTGAIGTTKQLLSARSLLTTKGELTNGGYLLFAAYPQLLFPQAYIRVIKFLTSQRGTGARLGVQEGADVRIEGPIPTAIQQAAQVVSELMPQRRALADSGLFEAQPIVPRAAWLEGVVNAVIHRSYSLAGDHIRVEIYPDRVEIESPGRFPGLANPGSPLQISRFARNPRDSQPGCPNVEAQSPSDGTAIRTRGSFAGRGAASSRCFGALEIRRAGDHALPKRAIKVWASAPLTISETVRVSSAPTAARSRSQPARISRLHCPKAFADPEARAVANSVPRPGASADTSVTRPQS